MTRCSCRGLCAYHLVGLILLLCFGIYGVVEWYYSKFPCPSSSHSFSPPQIAMHPSINTMPLLLHFLLCPEKLTFSFLLAWLDHHRRFTERFVWEGSSGGPYPNSLPSAGGREHQGLAAPRGRQLRARCALRQRTSPHRQRSRGTAPRRGVQGVYDESS